MNGEITLKKDPKNESYQVFRHGAYIGQATPGYDGTVSTFTPYTRDFDAGVYSDKETAYYILEQILELSKEGKIEPTEE